MCKHEQDVKRRTESDSNQRKALFKISLRSLIKNAWGIIISSSDFYNLSYRTSYLRRRRRRHRGHRCRRRHHHRGSSTEISAST